MMYHSVQPQRYSRSKGMKVKHLVQLVALTVLFTWFLYQLSSSHRAKVLSRRAEGVGEVDEDLLISADSEDAIGFGQDAVVDGPAEVQEEFIDKKSARSVSSRRMGPPDMLEVEQAITEQDLVEDVHYDSGESDRNDRPESDDEVRLADETKAMNAEKDQNGHHNGAPGAAEDRGDREDEMAKTILSKEVGASEGSVSTNSTETVEDNTLNYTVEDIKARGLDVSKEKTSSNDKTANPDDSINVDGKGEIVASQLSEGRDADEKEADVSKLDDDKGIDYLSVSNATPNGHSNATLDIWEQTFAEEHFQITPDIVIGAADEQSASTAPNIEVFHDSDSRDSDFEGITIPTFPDELDEGTQNSGLPDVGDSKEFSVEGNTMSTSLPELNEGAVEGATSPQYNAHAEAELEHGAEDKHENFVTLGDGQDSEQQEPVVTSVSEDQPLHPETIVEVVEQDKNVQQEGIAESGA